MSDDDKSPAIESLVGDRARDDKGRFIPVTPTEVQPEKAEPVKAVEPPKEPPKVEIPSEPPKEIKPPETSIPIQALLDEREKRQAHERELKELRAQLESLQKKPEPEIDPYQDLPGALKRHQQTLQQQMHERFVMLSEDMARSVHKDFDEVIGHFEKAVQANPALANQMNASRNPAEFAYQQGLWHREVSQAGDPVAYRTKLETELRQKIEAEFQAKYGKQPETVIPESLNSGNSPPAKDAVYAGPPSLKSILLNAKQSRS